MANLPNPFWSDALQQEFRRAQQMVQEDPGERGAATREGDESEREPPYELGPQAQETPEAAASTARDDVPHELAPCPAEVLRIDPIALATQPQEPEAQVAREASPGHYSVTVTGYSEFSAMECGAVKAEDDRELVPVQPEATDPMLRVLMQDQQSLVERIEKLASSKASSSSAGATSSIPEPHPRAVLPPQFVGRPAVTGKPANLEETGTGPGGEMSQMGPPTETQAQAPSAGVVELEGSKDAWRITPEGLKLEKQTASVAEVLNQRARSPLKPRTPNSPKQTQGPGNRSESPQRSHQPVRTSAAQEASKLLDVGGGSVEGGLWADLKPKLPEGFFSDVADLAAPKVKTPQELLGDVAEALEASRGSPQAESPRNIKTFESLSGSDVLSDIAEEFERNHPRNVCKLTLCVETARVLNQSADELESLKLEFESLWLRVHLNGRPSLQAQTCQQIPAGVGLDSKIEKLSGPRAKDDEPPELSSGERPSNQLGAGQIAFVVPGMSTPCCGDVVFVVGWTCWSQMWYKLSASSGAWRVAEDAGGPVDEGRGCGIVLECSVEAAKGDNGDNEPPGHPHRDDEMTGWDPSGEKSQRWPRAASNEVFHQKEHDRGRCAVVLKLVVLALSRWCALVCLYHQSVALFCVPRANRPDCCPLVALLVVDGQYRGFLL